MKLITLTNVGKKGDIVAFKSMNQARKAMKMLNKYNPNGVYHIKRTSMCKLPKDRTVLVVNKPVPLALVAPELFEPYL